MKAKMNPAESLLLSLVFTACAGQPSTEHDTGQYQSEEFADCDGDPTNGAETNIASDPDNCGECYLRCAGYNADVVASTCEQQECRITECPWDANGSVWFDCDGDAFTGCETVLWPSAADRPIPIGETVGDAGYDVNYRAGMGEAWFRMRLTESVQGPFSGAHPIAALVSLEMQMAGDYDLEVLGASSCGPDDRSRDANWTQARTSCSVSYPDGWADDSTELAIHVKPLVSNVECRSWHLGVKGNRN